MRGKIGENKLKSEENMKKLKEILMAGVVLIGAVLPVAVTSGRAMAEVDTTEEENARIAITRILPEQNKIAIMMRTQYYTGRAENLTIWRWKDTKKQDRAARVYKCGELKKDPDAEVLFESCDIKKEDWYNNFNRFFEVWLDVPEGILQNNYQMRLNVSSTFALEGRVSRAFNVVYADCFSHPAYIAGMECAREVIERINGVYEIYAPREIGIKPGDVEKIERSYNWNHERLDDGRKDVVEVEKINLFTGEIELKYYDDETVAKRESKMEFGPLGKKSTPGEIRGGGEDLEGKNGEKVERVRIFYSGDKDWKVVEKVARETSIYEGEIRDDMRNGDKIRLSVGDAAKKNYTGIVYLEATMKNGRKILQKVKLKDCLTLDNFGEDGKEVCAKKYNERGRIYYGIEGDDSVYELRFAEKWEKESEVIQNRKLLEELIEKGEEFDRKNSKKDKNSEIDDKKLTKEEAARKKAEEAVKKKKEIEEKKIQDAKKKESEARKKAEEVARKKEEAEQNKKDMTLKKAEAKTVKEVLAEKQKMETAAKQALINEQKKSEKLEKTLNGLMMQGKTVGVRAIDKKVEQKKSEPGKNEQTVSGHGDKNETIVENSDGEEKIPVPNTGLEEGGERWWVLFGVSGSILMVMIAMMAVILYKKINKNRGKATRN